MYWIVDSFTFLHIIIYKFNIYVCARAHASFLWLFLLIFTTSICITHSLSSYRALYIYKSQKSQQLSYYSYYCENIYLYIKSTNLEDNTRVKRLPWRHFFSILGKINYTIYKYYNHVIQSGEIIYFKCHLIAHVQRKTPNLVQMCLQKWSKKFLKHSWKSQ